MISVDIIEDDKDLRDYLAHVLEKNKLPYEAYSDLESYIYSKKPKGNVLLLDLMLEKETSHALVEKIRKNKKNVGIIMVSAVKTMETRIELLELGADDFISKPFDERELLARLHAVAKRYPLAKKTGKIELVEGQIYFAKEPISLTAKEKQVFLYLYERANTIVSKEEIVSNIWGGKLAYHSNVLETTIRRIRAKLPKATEILEVVPTQGYRFNNDEKK